MWKNRSLGISDDQTRHADCRRGRDNLRRYIRSGTSCFLPEGPNTGNGPGCIDWIDGEREGGNYPKSYQIRNLLIYKKFNGTGLSDFLYDL